MNGCISTPISWLKLEHYALGEPAAERAEIATHLDECAACAACLLRIEADAARELPPLPAAKVLPLRPRRMRAFSIASGLALAAAALLGIRWQTRETPRDPARGAQVKGDAVAFTLVRDDNALFSEAGATFREGDRFKVLVTCPPARRTSFDVVVFDGAEKSFPIAPSALECGNEVPLPGAFRVTGTESLRVCLVWSDGPVDRREIVRLGDQAIGTHGACKVLTRAP